MRQVLIGAVAVIALGTVLPACDKNPSAHSSHLAATSEFLEGVHYTRVAAASPRTTGADQIEVLELFFYTCPYCDALEPYLDDWREHEKPAYVRFRRIPMAWDTATRLQARMFYTAQALGRLDELHPQIFQAIQRGENLDTPETIGSFFAAHGVPAATFTQVFQSPELGARLSEEVAIADRYHIDSAPTIIVNGHYITRVEMAGGKSQLVKLVNELIASEWHPQ